MKYYLNICSSNPYIDFMKTRNDDVPCGCKTVNHDLVKKITGKMPPEENISELAAFFKICGDPTRMKILFALFASEMCVCDISTLLKMSLSSVSHQLRTLKQVRMVSSRKSGQNVYYRASDMHVKRILIQGMKHLTE